MKTYLGVLALTITTCLAPSGWCDANPVDKEIPLLRNANFYFDTDAGTSQLYSNVTQVRKVMRGTGYAVKIGDYFIPFRTARDADLFIDEILKDSSLEVHLNKKYLSRNFQMTGIIGGSFVGQKGLSLEAPKNLAETESIWIKRTPEADKDKRNELVSLATILKRPAYLSALREGNLGASGYQSSSRSNH